jgi:flagellar biosynthesis chaperone FliJ
MKAFRFPLKSLRVLREQKERTMQKRYVEALRASDTAAARLDVGRHELAAAWTALCEEVAEGATVGQLHQTRAWCGELERRCDQLEAPLTAESSATSKNNWMKWESIYDLRLTIYAPPVRSRTSRKSKIINRKSYDTLADIWLGGRPRGRPGLSRNVGTVDPTRAV